MDIIILEEKKVEGKTGEVAIARNKTTNRQNRTGKRRNQQIHMHVYHQ